MAASEMIETVNAQQFCGQALNVRIGIDSGPVVAGAVGAAGRLSYTIYGNPVNLAARLEGMNKEFSTSMLVSENTEKLAGPSANLRLVGQTSIRGQAETIEVFTRSSSA